MKLQLVKLETSSSFYENVKISTIEVYGIGEDGKNQHISVIGFPKTFYVKCTDIYGELIESILVSGIFFMHSIVIRIPFYGYNNTPFEFYKFELFNYFDNKKLLNELNKIKTIEGDLKTYEFKLYDYQVGFTKSVGLTGWLEFDEANDKIQKYNFFDNEITENIKICNYSQNSVEFKNDIASNIRGCEKKMLPMSIISFDIECVKLDGRGGFPVAECDPIIMIGCYYGKMPGIIDFKKLLFTYKTYQADEDNDIEVVVCENEGDMIIRFVKFIHIFDPDIITGYNIIGFDIPYIKERIERLKLPSSTMKWGRSGRDLKIFIPNTLKYKSVEIEELDIEAFELDEEEEGPSKKKMKTNKKAQPKTNKNFNGGMNSFVQIPGRVVCDLLKKFKDLGNLESYKLNFVANKYLKNYKMSTNIHKYRGEEYEQIQISWEKDDIDRFNLIKYCVNDAELVIHLAEVRKIILNDYTMAQCCNTEYNTIVTRRQQARSIALILHTLREDIFIICDNFSDLNSNKNFNGGMVIEPKFGFYKGKVSTLDYASLYPSIMIRHNLCYTTLIIKDDDSEYNGTLQCYKSPTRNDYFVKETVRQGILPKILNHCLAERKKVKELMNKTEDPLEKELYNSLQLAHKLNANALYGFTGVGGVMGILPCIQISRTVTDFGRDMITKAKDLIEDMGYNVIYGDTDSIMIDFEDIDIIDALKLGNELAAYVNKFFQEPCKIEFEKIYHPYLMLDKKKKYAGGHYDASSLKEIDGQVVIKRNKIDVKGIQSVRSDTIPLVTDAINFILEEIIGKADEQSTETSKNNIKVYLNKVLDDLLVYQDVDIFKLKKGQKITKNIEDYGNRKVSHICTIKKMQSRSGTSFSTPQVGDKISYIVLKGPTKMVTNNVEDPIYTLNNELEWDSKYYANSLITATQSILKLIFPLNELDEIFKKKRVPQKRVYDIEDLFSKTCNLYNECKTCQGPAFPTKCSNTSCDIFFQRTQVLNLGKQIVKEKRNVNNVNDDRLLEIETQLSKMNFYN